MKVIKLFGKKFYILSESDAERVRAKLGGILIDVENLFWNHCTGNKEKLEQKTFEYLVDRLNYLIIYFRGK